MKTMQKHGLRVKQVRGGNATEVGAPNVEAMIGAMGQSGVTHYWIGTDNYDLSKPILPQLDAIKRKVEQFVKVNQKHGTTLMYHTRAGANSVGSVVWDLLYVMRDFDPRHVGFHWDTGHMSHHGSNTWELLMRTAGPYVVGMGWKDRTWEQNLGFLGEGGPYPGLPPPQRRSQRAVDGPVVAAVAVAAELRPQVMRPLERLVPAAAPVALPVPSPAQVERAVRRMQPAVVRLRERLREGKADLPPLAGAAAAGVAVAAAVRPLFRCPSPGTRSRGAVDGVRLTCRWAWGSWTSSGTRPCCATSGSMVRWNWKPSIQTEVRRARPTS